MKKQLVLYWICSKRDTQAPDIYMCIAADMRQHKEEIHALLVLTSSAEKHPSLKRVRDKEGDDEKKMMITYESWHTEWFFFGDFGNSITIRRCPCCDSPIYEPIHGPTL